MRTLTLAAILIASVSTQALAQRANENAVASADDAFGTSVGAERIGLYSVVDVRGFNPITAGNIRLEGLAVTEHGGFTSRIVSGNTIRVGLTAQGYPFTAPTGIADYALRNAGDEALVSPFVYYGPNDTKGFDVDTQLPIIPGRLGLAAGIGYRYEENLPGEDGEIIQGGGVLRWRPNQAVEIKSFYGQMAIDEDRDLPSIFSGGAYLPPKIERRNFGQKWQRGESDRHFYGIIGNARLAGNWQLRGGLFRWDLRNGRSQSELFRAVEPDGDAQRTLVTSRDQRTASTSGDARLSYSLTEGGRRHTLLLAVRGRSTRRQSGGADVRDLGPGAIGRRDELPEPVYTYGEFTRDEIEQLTGGLGYELRWPRVGELTLGVQKSDYTKKSFIPGVPLLTTIDRPWLYNAALALHVAEGLVAYAGYTTGLEDSGAAPPDAVNRSFAPPALRTDQRDAGLRYALTSRLNLVAGVFDVRKPYFNTDTDRVYRELGKVRHRGVELSLAGQPLAGLNLVAGAVLLDADVAGEAVDLGVIGPKPVATTARTLRANLDYRMPFFDPVSVDLGVTSLSGKIASARGFAELGGEQLRTEARTIVDIGMRYRLRSGKWPVTLRGQVTNLFDSYVWEVGANASFRPSDTRRVMVSLAADL